MSAVSCERYVSFEDHGVFRIVTDALSESGPDQCGAPDHGEDTGQSGGLPIEAFDGFRKSLADNRAQFYLDIASGPFYRSIGRARRQSPASFRTGGVRA